MDIITVCPICHKEHIISVELEDYLAWCDGAHAQNAFPYLSAEDREMLISGICPQCWEKTFGEVGEETDLGW